ncbi:MAG: DUF2085 domain-containing protein [Pyrinomonadaceae bacterium]|nr:DUF2085 domain-containing protein [Pyrinomonadaceae bacterium]
MVVYRSQTFLSRSLIRRDFLVWVLTAFAVWLWVGLIILAPVLRGNGFEDFAHYIYAPFGFICHQIGARSFHVSDEPFAVCARCFGVYFGLAFGVSVYPLFRSIHNVNSLPRIFLLLAPVPTSVDFLLGYYGIWANTHLSRFITASVLGFVCAFFVIPGIVEISRAFRVPSPKSKSPKSF